MSAPPPPTEAFPGRVRRTLRELLDGGARQVGAAALGFLSYPVIARVLDERELGVWSLVAAAAFVMILSDLGLSTAVQRAAVATDPGRTRRTFGLSLLVILAVAPALGVGAYFLALNFGEVSADLRSDARQAAVVAMMGGLVGALGHPFTAFAYVRGGATEVAKARSLGTLLNVAVTCGGFLLVPRVQTPAVGMLLGNLLEAILTIRAARRLDPSLPLRPIWPTDRAETVRAFRDGAAALSIHAFVVMSVRIDLFVLEWSESRRGLVEGMSARAADERALTLVGFYALASRTIDSAYVLAKQANTAIMRRLGQREDRALALRLGTGVFGGLVVSGMAVLGHDAQPFLILVLGDKASAETVTVVLMLLSAAAMLLATYEIASTVVMLGAQSAWSCALPILAGTLVNLVVSIGGAPRYSVWAVATGTALGNAVTGVLMWRTLKHLLQIGWREVLSVLSPVAVAGLLSLSGALAVRTLVTGAGTSFVLSVLVTGLGCGGAAFVLRRTVRP